MAVLISKPAINLREELASLRNQGGLPKEDKLYVGDFIQNGDFSNGTTGWTNYDAPTTTFIETGGQLQITASGGNARVRSGLVNLVAGRSYRFTVTCTQKDNNGASFVHLGKADNFGSYYVTNLGLDEPVGTYTHEFTAEGTELWIQLGAKTSSNSVTYDNVSVQEVGENLVTNGTFDYDSGWTKETGWTISGGTASCDGSQTGNSGLSTSDYSQYTSGKVFSITYTISNYVAGQVNLHIRGNGAGNVSGNGTYNQTVTAGTATGYGINLFADSAFNADIDNVVITEGNHNVIQSIPYGYDVKDVYIDGELAREGEAYDYEVKTDGINQWLKPTVEPTATTETVVIGVRK